VTRDDAYGVASLVAYVVPGGQPVPAAELRLHLLRVLPSYMVPQQIVILDALPVLPNGKLDRRALPDPASHPRGDAEQRTHVVAETETECVLTMMWESLLQVDQVAVTDLFEDLGGTSISAARLIGRINEYFGCSLSPDVLLEAATVRQLARVIDGEFTVQGTVFVPLRKAAGAAPVVLLLPGIGGHIFSFQRFARALPIDATIYGLRPFGMNGENDLPLTFGDIAEKYVDNLTRIEPVGPYIIAGYSFGSSLAFEIAQRLEKLGKPVQCFISFDSNAPNYPAPPGLLSKACLIARQSAATGWRVAALRFWSLMHETVLSREEIIQREVEEIRHEWRDILPARFYMENVLPVIWNAGRRYLASGMLAAPVVLIRTTQSVDTSEDDLRQSTCGWSDRARTVEVRVVEGAHERMFNEEMYLAVAEATGLAIDALEAP
jgi:thioesterase domain-containing protein/acyl carrier protein